MRGQRTSAQRAAFKSRNCCSVELSSSCGFSEYRPTIVERLLIMPYEK